MTQKSSLDAQSQSDGRRGNSKFEGVAYRGLLDYLGVTLQNRDQFGEGFHMKLDEGTSVVQTKLGACYTLIVIFLVAAYAMQKTEILINRKDIDVLSTVNDSHYNEDFVFKYEDGFNLAVALTAYDSNPEPILDPRIGELVFNHYSWGPNRDGTFGSQRLRIESQHECSREELGLGDSGSADAD